MKQFDVTIIGNGVLGYSIGFALSEEDPQLKIAIIGSSDASGSATTASGAMLGCFGEVTTATFKSVAARKKFEMSLEAKHLWDNWIELINSKASNALPLNTKPGTFVLLNTKSGKLDSENYAAILQSLDKYKEDYEIIDPNHIPGINPIDTNRPLQAIYLPNEGTINPIHLLENLRLALNKNPNIKFIDSGVKSLKLTAGRINQIITSKGENITTHSTIIAAGAYSQTLIDQINDLRQYIPRLFFGCGSSMVIEGKQPTSEYLIRTPNRSFACGLHMLPRNKHSYYVGATNNVELEPEIYPRIGTFHFLQQCALEQLNQDFYSFKMIGWNTGNRPVTIDTFPLIGETSIPGLWILTGTYRDGLHQSPLLAKFLAKKFIKDISLFNNIFKPERSPIQTMTKEEAIIEAVKHYMSGGYEHGMSMPKVGWDKMFEDMLYRKIKQLYDDLDTDYVLPPDFLLMFDMDRNKHLEFFRTYYSTIKNYNNFEKKFENLVYA